MKLSNKASRIIYSDGSSAVSIKPGSLRFFLLKALFYPSQPQHFTIETYGEINPIRQHLPCILMEAKD